MVANNLLILLKTDRMKNIFLGLMLFAISAFSFSQEVVGEEKKIG